MTVRLWSELTRLVTVRMFAVDSYTSVPMDSNVHHMNVEKMTPVDDALEEDQYLSKTFKNNPSSAPDDRKRNRTV